MNRAVAETHVQGELKLKPQNYKFIYIFIYQQIFMSENFKHRSNLRRKYANIF